jgi:BirA family biotin operon repressor/biotin-[acetyl-CoA-carboxylase] ligase
MTNPREEIRPCARRIGRRVLVYDRLDSTNSAAARLADDPANDGVAVRADVQTAGRGQHGRTWQAPPGSSLLLSVLVFPSQERRRPAVLTAWAAVAVCETVRDLTGADATIKWPNAVLVDGRKVAGILIEQGRGAVIGVGLNLRQTADDLAAAGLPFATSLARFTSTPPDVSEAADRLLYRMEQHYERLCCGDLATLEAAWIERLGLVGRDVRAECLDGVHRGWLAALGFDGAAVESPDGTVVLVRPETILHLDAAVALRQGSGGL